MYDSAYHSLLLNCLFLKALWSWIQQAIQNPLGRYSGTMLYLGLAAIVFVPVFKMATHLPPYVGMMLSLSSGRYLCRNIQFFKI